MNRNRLTPAAPAASIRFRFPAWSTDSMVSGALRTVAFAVVTTVSMPAQAARDQRLGVFEVAGDAFGNPGRRVSACPGPGAQLLRTC